MSKIKVLDRIVAARIAAGEVIDRPAAIARELIDNSIDAKATEISIDVRGGGIESLSVIDNGCGIEKDDLPLTTQPHATSKISDLDDLYHLNTMGFRGEALYSISSVSKLTISSNGWTYVANCTTDGELTKGGCEKGTRITSEDLFKSLPVRRSFLKRESSEAQLIKNTFISKAMAFENIHFKYYQDGALKIDLPNRNTLKDRVLDILTLDQKLLRPDFTYLESENSLYKIRLITSLPSLHRSDRSGIKIYVNSRSVEEYSLVQAVSYGYGESLPGGAFPYSVVFIDENPELVDFNIHPAKKEVKIRNRAEIHHAISTLISDKLPKSIPTIVSSDEQMVLQPTTNKKVLFEDKDFIYQQSISNEIKNSKYEDEVYSPKKSYIEKPKDNSWLEKAKNLSNINRAFETKPASKEEFWTPKAEKKIQYIGQAFKLFLICECEDKLYLVDQHAAHERVIFNELREQKSVQKLLIPYEFEVEGDIDAFLCEHSDVYTQFGIALSKKEDKLWMISALPALAKPYEKEVAQLVKTKIGSDSEIEAALYAIIACKAAIKAGDEIDRFSAEALLEKVFELEDPACPHGRTFIVMLDENELRKMVGRTK